MSDQPKWFTLSTTDSNDYRGDICATRDEAIAQGVAMKEPGQPFYVVEGKRVMEAEVAEWLIESLEDTVYDGNMEASLEIGSDDPILEVDKADFDALLPIIEAWIKERKLLRTWYRWDNPEKIENGDV